MNTIFTLLFALFFSCSLFSQIQVDTCTTNFYFPDNYGNYDPDLFILIDTLSNPENIWQIGVPQKDNINLPYTPGTPLVTDTMLPYPTNDTSSFIIPVCHPYCFCPYVGQTFIYIWYYMDSDSLNDFGKIEISYDWGTNWFNIDTVAELVNSDPPILTGNSGGLKSFEFDPIFLADQTAMAPIFMNFEDNWGIQFPTVMLLRFTFISDDIPENKMGWVIESIDISHAVYSSVDDQSKDHFSTIVTPNPANHVLQLQIENDPGNNFEIQLYSISGKLVHRQILQNKNETTIDVASFSNGIYHYSILNQTTHHRSFGKFVVQH